MNLTHHHMQPPANNQHMFTLGGETMGTTWSVCLLAHKNTDPRTLYQIIEQPLALVVQQMSSWDANTDLSRFNRADAGQWQNIPNEFAHVMTHALRIAEQSNGAFDPTVGSLVGLWGFGASASTDTPSPEHLQHMRQQMGWQRLAFDVSTQRIQQPGGLQLDLSAIAKGFATDLVASALQTHGINSALVEIGGELYGFGHKQDGSAWAVLVEAGSEEDNHTLEPRVLALENLAVATSGDRWHHHTRDGQHYTHTIDPRTGLPMPHTQLAVSVIAARTLDADAWATAFSVMDVDTGFALAHDLGLGVRFLYHDGQQLVERMNATFKAHLLP